MAVMDIISPNQHMSAYLANLPVGSELNVLDSITLIGAQDLCILRDVKQVSTNSIRSVFFEDQIKKARKAQDSAKPYNSQLVNSAENTVVELSNVTQHFDDSIIVDDTMNAMAQYSGETLMAYQRAKKGIEHAKDIEGAFWSDTVPTIVNPTDSSNAFNLLGGVWGFVPTAHEVDYRNPTTGAPTQALTADILFAMQQKVYDSGANPRNIYCGSSMKRKISALIQAEELNKFTNTPSELARLFITQIETDFGITNIILSRFFGELGIQDRLACIDPEFIELANLIPTNTKEVAYSGTGTAERIQTVCTFHYRNTATLAAVYGLM